ncbi:MAG TPA: hypothetical protein VFF06_31435 [Polyangia bacterium]|nr:hypothetical protein [Polyangia bacterium]
MPPTAIVDPSGFYVVNGSLTFHDVDDVVQTLRVTIPLVSMQYEYPVGLSSGTINLTVKFSSATPKGPQQYLITLVDAGGETAVATKTVTLE